MSSEIEKQFDEFLMPERPPANTIGGIDSTQAKASAQSEKETSPEDEVRMQSVQDGASDRDSEPAASESHGAGQAAASGTINDIAWGIAVILGLIVIVLSFLLLSQSNTPTPKQADSSQARAKPLSSHADSSGDSAASWKARESSLMRQLEEARSQIAEERVQHQDQLTQKEHAFRELTARLKVLGDQNKLLVKENDELKRSDAIEPEPHGIQAEYNETYTVRGLRAGDSLNVRSGPGTNYSPIARLRNGSSLEVTGPSVANGKDRWLPCSSEPLFRQGWVNSFFVHETPKP